MSVAPWYRATRPVAPETSLRLPACRGRRAGWCRQATGSLYQLQSILYTPAENWSAGSIPRVVVPPGAHGVERARSSPCAPRFSGPQALLSLFFPVSLFHLLPIEKHLHEDEN